MAHNLSELANYYKNASGSPNYVARLVAQSITQEQQASGQSVKSILRQGFTLPRDCLDAAFLFESYGYLKKALYHYLAYKHVQSGGYKSWADVTAYYGRFFGIIALTRLMGAGIFWDKDTGSFQVERNHGSYTVGVPPEGRGSHAKIWKLFYHTFANFKAPKGYESVFTALHPILSSKESYKTYEIRSRNWINYSIEYGYGELDFKERGFIEAEKWEGTKPFLDRGSYEAADERLLFDTFLLGLEALKMIADTQEDSRFGPNEFLSIVETFSCTQEIKNAVTSEISEVCKAAA